LEEAAVVEEAVETSEAAEEDLEEAAVVTVAVTEAVANKLISPQDLATGNAPTLIVVTQTSLGETNATNAKLPNPLELVAMKTAMAEVAEVEAVSVEVEAVASAVEIVIVVVAAAVLAAVEVALAVAAEVASVAAVAVTVEAEVLVVAAQCVEAVVAEIDIALTKKNQLP